MTKRALVCLLVGLNAVLFTVLVVAAWDLPKAHAQAVGLASNYLMVAAEINDDHDALYVCDLATRIMHVFEVDRTSRQLIRIDMRDLRQDFNR